MKEEGRYFGSRFKDGSQASRCSSTEEISKLE